MKITFRGVCCLICLALTAYFGSLSPSLWQFIKEEKQLPPPGIKSEKRELLTVWTLGEDLGAGAWVKKQCAAFEKAQTAVHVWIRAASAADMALIALEPEAAPDVIIFAAGESVAPELLRETGSGHVLSTIYARSGQHQDRQIAVPLAVSGYVLAEKSSAPTVTPVPRSLFGVTPAPAPDAPAPAPARVSWPERVFADDRFGALALGSMDAKGEAVFLPPDELAAQFAAGKIEAAVLSIRQLRQLSRQGVGYEVICAAAATDQALFAARTQKSGDTAERLLAFLLSAPAQGELRDAALLPVCKGLHAFSKEQTALRALDRAMENAEVVNAFSWPKEREATAFAWKTLLKSKF